MNDEMSGSGLIADIRGFGHLNTFLQEYHKEFSVENSSLSFYHLVSKQPEEFERELIWVGERKSKFDIELEKIDEDRDRDLYSISIRHEKFKHTTEGDLLAIVNYDENLVQILSDEGTDVIDSCMAITNTMYPVFQRVYISSDMMLGVLSSFPEAGYSGHCRQYSCQRWWEEGHKPKTLVEYPTEIPLDVVLDELNKPSISLKMFHGYLTIDEEDVLEFYISRDGEMKYRSGRFDLFEEIVTSIKKDMAEEFEKFNNISQDSNEPYLDITFQNIAEEKEQNIIIDRFREAVDTENTFGEAVIHSGNPYYHSSVSDRASGSSFDIIFARENSDFQLKILPNYDISSLTILKFKKTIFSEFGEGDIKRISQRGD